MEAKKYTLYECLFEDINDKRLIFYEFYQRESIDMNLFPY